MVEFYNLSGEDVLEELNSNGNGLSNEEVSSRKKLYGLNELESKHKINPIVLFFNQFKSFIIYILLFAVTISIVANEYIDAIVIIVILLFNAFFGFIQEYKAEKAIDALRKLSGLKARVIRNGKEELVDTKNLVPGDILLLEEGNKIPADARILESIRMRVLEASLTGESVPVSKISNLIKGDLAIQDKKNMLFSGTSIASGRGTAVITLTGMKTEIGKIAGMISNVQDEMTPLQKKLESLGKWIGLGTIIICAMVFMAGIIRDNILSILLAGDVLGFILAAKNWFLTAVSLAVAAVPEGLPAIVTIALAIGVRKMVKKHALIRKLPSVETLGEATVICSDKTGTLTRNEMTVVKAYTNDHLLELTGEGYEFKGKVSSSGLPIKKDDKFLFHIGVLCNNAKIERKNKKNEISGDPTEASLLVSAEKADLKHKDLLKKWKRTDENPFDSIRKMMSTVNVDPKDKSSFIFTKGATENVLKKCNRILINGKIKTLTKEQKENILAKNDEFASQALRVLGFAYKKIYKKEQAEKDLIFVGLQAMIDPPHSSVKDSIEKCKQAGIRVIMITGDNQVTAEAIARKIGIEGKSMQGYDFEKLDDNDQKIAIEEVNIFSRVEPAHKMAIVSMLQEKGHVVAMTGDGVNDAPAIKKADLGIAMGIAGTDVAKESSDMVLMDDDFTSIVDAIEEGRGIYENIRKFVNFLLSCNLGEVLVIFIAIILGWPLPMTAIMILWMNLVTDGLPALALSIDPNPANLMSKPPKKTGEGIMNKSMMFNIGYVSVLITIGVLSVFNWAMNHYQYLDNDLFMKKIQTIAFTALIITEMVRLQAIRSEYKLGLFSNKYLVLAVMTSISLQLLVIYTPLRTFFGTAYLSFLDWGLILGMSAIVYVLNIAGSSLKNKLAWFEE